MTKNDIIRTGKYVLETEAKAVKTLASRLDESFVKAVELLFQTKSRVIVTGMGKSGHVGRKIAATLASCGTPAIFIHPAEAGHGDLGMILKEDILIAISYSGETRELVDLLDYVKRAGIKLISITGDKNSKLGKYSDIVLEAKVEKEAEPNGMIPTASSTAALAMGDAVAIALMKKKGFGEKDFVFFHPRGEARKKLLKIENLMHKGRKVARVSQETPMKAVLEEITRKKLGMTCVIDKQERLLGIITDGDLRRLIQKFGKNLLQKTAQDCMTPNPVTIDKADLATKGLNLMEKNKITSLIIKNKKGGIEGIIHLHDLWRTEMF
ncbi:MAG: KpsF/GutQ family sugar-phosphate isomerase [Candidatus Aminicenantes bacterium]|jgi:arabinose-5-phosphate isomerase|nr:KpsF/GutQ family sugar-phosphate isomerase [Candidatus Aminicenantes bacterium]